MGEGERGWDPGAHVSSDKSFLQHRRKAGYRNKKWVGFPSLALGGSEAQHLCPKGKAALVQTGRPGRRCPLMPPVKILSRSQTVLGTGSCHSSKGETACQDGAGAFLPCQFSPSESKLCVSHGKTRSKWLTWETQPRAVYPVCPLWANVEPTAS